jgi:hypothetical protein
VAFGKIGMFSRLRSPIYSYFQVNRPRGRGLALLIGVNLSLNAYPTYVLPPLIPPCKGGKKKSSSLPFTRGGLGWGNADRDGQ